MNLRTAIILMGLLIFKNYLSAAQSPTGTVGSWLMFFNQIRVHERWSIHNEFQYRSYEFTPNTEQTLLRTGLNYHINNSTLASIGYANVTNFAFDKEISPGIKVLENRLWQQFLMKNNIGRCFFEHRYRLEQRWLRADNNNRYLNRARVLLRMTIPLNKKTIEKHTVFLTFYNEVFIHLSSTPFDRNRLFGAVGFQFLPNMNIQLGYLAQTVNTTTKHYLQTAVNYNFDLRKKNN